MKTLDFSLETQLKFSAPVTHHNFVLRFVPADRQMQTILRHQVLLNPQIPLLRQRDGFGNLLLSGDILQSHQQFDYTVLGTAQVDFSRRRPETPHPMYRYPGLLTQPDAALFAFAKAATVCADSPRQKAEAICKAVTAHFVYTPGVTQVSTTAAQSFALGQGVCQDYSHVMLALCRLNGLAARYCAGYTVGEGATHAWVEVCLPEGWVGFDPTRDCMVDETYLQVASGRDYADCPLERGVFRGAASQTQSVLMQVKETIPEIL